MYLAKFSAPEAAIVQGLVWLPALPRLPPGLRAQWWQSYGQLVEGIHAVGGAGASLRMVLAPGGSLHQALFACAPPTRAAQLRRFLAPFTRLDTLVTGSASLPLSREEYDAVADDVPIMRCRVAMPSFSASGAWLACNFRVAPLLDSLAAEAEAYGYRIGYQVNIRPLTVDRQWVRAARRHALDVRDLPGIPRPLAQLQRQLADQLAYATAVAEEYLAVDAGPAVQWLQEMLRRHFHRQCGALGFEPPSWEFIEWAYEEALACAAFTASNELQIDEICASAIEDAEIVRLLNWRPADGLANRFAGAYEPDALERFGDPVPPNTLPSPYDGNDPYLFVSYKRTDLDRVAPILTHLRECGHNLWYDRGIPGGADWNAVLEERLTSCSALLVFVSQAAVESKYVRREVRFADSVNKPIISVRLEPTRLGHGLSLLLTHYQMLELRDRDFHAQLDRALKLV